jgi:hypothetical protein
VVSHRDPLKCIPSIASTSVSSRLLYSDLDSSERLTAELLGMFSHAASEHLRWRDANPQVPALDLGFREVNSDGIAAARRVYDFIGMEMSVAAVERMRRWEQNNMREKHGKAVYSPEAFGMTDTGIREAFASYIDRFGNLI